MRGQQRVNEGTTEGQRGQPRVNEGTTEGQ
jgi:hypothetical protein